MKTHRQAACVATALGSLLAASPASGQPCENSPGTPGRFREPREIDGFASMGLRSLNDERRLSGPARERARGQREAQFRNVSALHWRWTCDHRQGLASKPTQRALVLIQGVMFFDLAEDLPNMTGWYSHAQSLVRQLQVNGAPLPSYRNLSAPRLLELASARLNPARRESGGWYVEIDAKD